MARVSLFSKLRQASEGISSSATTAFSEIRLSSDEFCENKTVEQQNAIIHNNNIRALITFYFSPNTIIASPNPRIITLDVMLYGGFCRYFLSSVAKARASIALPR